MASDQTNGSDQDQVVVFQGVEHHFPASFTEDQISQALTSVMQEGQRAAAPTTADLLARRGLALSPVTETGQAVSPPPTSIWQGLRPEAALVTPVPGSRLGNAQQLLPYTLMSGVPRLSQALPANVPPGVFGQIMRDFANTWAKRIGVNPENIRRAMQEAAAGPSLTPQELVEAARTRQAQLPFPQGIRAPLEFTPPQDAIQAEIEAARRAAAAGTKAPAGLTNAEYQQLREQAAQTPLPMGTRASLGGALQFTPPQDAIQSDLELAQRAKAAGTKAPPGLTDAEYQRLKETQWQGGGRGGGAPLEFMTSQEAWKNLNPIEQARILKGSGIQQRGTELLTEIKKAATRAENPIKLNDWQQGFVNNMTKWVAQGAPITEDQMLAIFRTYAQLGLAH